MGFSKQVVTSIADAISKLNTFLIAEGWTTHHVPASGEFAARKTPASVPGTFDIALAMQWDTVTPGIAGIYQHLGAYNSGAAPFAQVDDSGNGAASTTSSVLVGQRFINITNTPEQMWVFTDAAGTYFHVVVDISGGTDAQHFGAGALALYGDGDVVGGEYVYGQRVETGVTSLVALLAGSTTLLDGLSLDGTPPTGVANMEEFVATVHLEGFPNQPGGASGKWCVHMGNQPLGNLGVDRAAVARGLLHGGFRAGPGVLQWGQFEGNVASGLQPGYPLNSFYNDVSTSGVDIHGPLGRVRDVRGINIANFALGDTVTIGSDTWHLFPTFKKGEAGGLSGTTGHQGIMYKEIP